MDVIALIGIIIGLVVGINLISGGTKFLHIYSLVIVPLAIIFILIKGKSQKAKKKSLELEQQDKKQYDTNLFIRVNGELKPKVLNISKFKDTPPEYKDTKSKYVDNKKGVSY